MNPECLKKTFFFCKHLVIALFLALLSISFYMAFDNELYRLLCLVILINLAAYWYLLEKNVNDRVVIQESCCFFVLLISNAIMVGLLFAPTSFIYMIFNASVSQNNETSVSMTMQGTNQNFSHFTNETMNKTAKPLEALSKIRDNAKNLGNDSLYEKSDTDESSDGIIFWIFIAMMILKPFIQFVIWMLAKKIATHPIDIEAAHQSEGLLQTTAPEDQNLDLERNLGEDPSSVNVVIRRKRMASGGKEDSSTEDLDGVDYDSLTIDSPLTELENKPKSEEKPPVSNLSASAVTTREKDSLQPISTNNVPKVVVTEASFQEEVPESSLEK